MPLFSVHPDCLDLGLRAGAIEFRGVTVSETPTKLVDLMMDQIDAARREFEDARQIRALPSIAEIHEILRRVGVKPKRHPPSTQKLLELAFKRGRIPRINNLVDAYNLVSLQTKCSLGAHDLDLVAPPITLRRFHGNESFRPLGSETEQAVVAGEFGYVDAAERVVCRLDSLQADFSKVTGHSRNVLVIAEATRSFREDQWQNVFAEATKRVVEFCGGSARNVHFPPLDD